MNDFVARSYSFLIVCIIVLLYSLFSNSAPQGCKCQFSSVPMPWEFLVDARTKVSLAWSGLWVQPGVSLLSCMMLASDVQTARKHSSCRAVYSIRYRPGGSDTICPPPTAYRFAANQAAIDPKIAVDLRPSAIRTSLVTGGG